MTAWRTASLVVLVLAGLQACGGSGEVEAALFVPTYFPPDPLTAAEAEQVIMDAVSAIDHPDLVAAVVDRVGNVLAVYSNRVPSNPDHDNLAVSLARTAAFFSNAQAPLSSRTVEFISAEHFPPIFTSTFVDSPCPPNGGACGSTVIAPQRTVVGVNGTPQGPLWQINATNRGIPFALPAASPLPPLTNPPTEFDVNRDLPLPVNIDGTAPGPGITRLPGGIPLYKPGMGAGPDDVRRVVGGVGVWIPGPNGPELDAMEHAALMGAGGFPFLPSIPPVGAVYLMGLLLPFVDTDNLNLPAGFSLGTFGTGAYVVTASDGVPEPSGWLISPRDSVDPPPAAGGLSALDVQDIIDRGIIWANGTRAAIRLPLGSSARMVLCVADNRGLILGLYRMEDATVFSVDVAVTKSRCTRYFSSLALDPLDQVPGVPPGVAMTTRTLGFLSQPFFPPGIQTSGVPGPLFDTALLNQLPAQASLMANAVPDPGYQSGVIFFPGATPLYVNGQLVGGFGVSGDGVEQDDFVTFGGSQGFLPFPSMRADAFSYKGVQLPYFKFPQNPGPGGF